MMELKCNYSDFCGIVKEGNLSNYLKNIKTIYVNISRERQFWDVIDTLYRIEKNEVYKNERFSVCFGKNGFSISILTFGSPDKFSIYLEQKD